jgi:hypothetical protein
VSASGLAIVEALVFAWGTLSARLERFDMTAPIDRSGRTPCSHRRLALVQPRILSTAYPL